MAPLESDRPKLLSEILSLYRLHILGQPQASHPGQVPVPEVCMTRCGERLEAVGERPGLGPRGEPSQPGLPFPAVSSPQAYDVGCVDRQQSRRVPVWRGMDLHSTSSGRATAWLPEAILSTPWCSEKSRLALPVLFLPCWASFSCGRTAEGRRRWGDHLGTSVSKWPLNTSWETVMRG